MKNNISTKNIFRNSDPETLKKNVTQKIEKLINRHLINLRKAG